MGNVWPQCGTVDRECISHGLRKGMLEIFGCLRFWPCGKVGSVGERGDLHMGGMSHGVRGEAERVANMKKEHVTFCQ